MYALGAQKNHAFLKIRTEFKIVCTVIDLFSWCIFDP
jgi:hypothetical protein